MNYADRVKDTSASVGKGPMTLFGAPITGFRSFLSAFPFGAVDVPYAIDDGAGNWEIGIGSFSDSVLTRTQVLSSSSNGGLVDFVAGKKSVICTLPADLVESATNRSIAAASESAGHAVQTAQDKAQTGLDRAATADDRLATAADKLQTGMDAAAASSAKTAAELAASSAEESASQAAAAAPVQSVAGKTGAVTLVKGDVGLGNVDNTSDANKPVSTAQQTALNGKENAGTAAVAVAAHEAASDPHPQYQVDLVSGTNIKTINGQSILGAGNIEIQACVINHIGTPGALGFGVGIAPTLPTNFVELAGCRDSASDNYGNYMHTSGSIMVWVPAFYYKWGTEANGLSVNVVDIKPFSAYADVATANASGYALHRAFYDGGVQPGFFIDKYVCSNLNGVFSSVKNGIPCDTDGSQSGIAALTGVGTNNYGFIQKACTQRGANFHSASIFMHRALALLSYAHAQASSNTAYCAWYNATYNFPKGCNNNALGDTNDAALSFTSAGHGTYPNKPKAGSGSVFAKTTHNGQNSGVSDLNGSMWEVAFGLTSDGTNYYLLKTTKKMCDLIGSDATSATSFFGTAGITANYDNIDATYGALAASNTAKLYGSTTQVFDAATSGNAWAATGAGLPLAGGVGGTNAFGSDGLWDYRPNELCPVVSAHWYGASSAGVWALHLATVRSSAGSAVGGRAALYL